MSLLIMFTAEHTNNVFWLAPFFFSGEAHCTRCLTYACLFFSSTWSFRLLNHEALFRYTLYPLSLANLVLPHVSLMMSGCQHSGQTIWQQWYWICLDYLCILCLSSLIRRSCECNGSANLCTVAANQWCAIRHHSTSIRR